MMLVKEGVGYWMIRKGLREVKKSDGIESMKTGTNISDLGREVNQWKHGGWNHLQDILASIGKIGIIKIG